MVWNGDTDAYGGGYRLNPNSGGNMAGGWDGFTLETYQNVYMQITKVTAGDYPYINFGNAIAYNANGNGVTKTFNPATGTYNAHQRTCYVSGGTNTNFVIHACYIMNTDGIISEEKYYGS